MSEYPVFERNGQTVFRNQEAGESVAGREISLSTEAGEKLRFVPV